MFMIFPYSALEVQNIRNLISLLFYACALLRDAPETASHPSTGAWQKPRYPEKKEPDPTGFGGFIFFSGTSDGLPCMLPTFAGGMVQVF